MKPPIVCTRRGLSRSTSTLSALLRLRSGFRRVAEPCIPSAGRAPGTRPSLLADCTGRRRARSERVPVAPDGDDLFELVGGSRLVACLNFTHDEPWIGYAEGFKRLADLDVAHIEETGHGHNFLV